MKKHRSSATAPPFRCKRPLRILWAVVCCVAVLAGLCTAGGPLKVAGISGFNTNLAGTPLTWPQGSVSYYTDQGDLSPVLPQAEANAFVADAFLRWTSVSTAALAAIRGGQLDEDVNGSNVIFINYGQVNMPADIQPTALAKPVAIVYDANGQVTDALLGAGAGAADMCGSNAAYGGLDNYSSDARLSHALVVLNGNCAQTAAALPDLKYHLIRVLGRVLGLDWTDLNGNVFNHKPSPTSDDYLGFPVMHALNPVCAASSVCFPAAEQLKMDDRATVSRLYPVTSANAGSFAGKQIFADTTARVHGTVYFRGPNGLAAQPMQGVKVVARWIDPATGLASHRYVMASVSGFLFRGNAGNAVTGFTDASGARYDQFGSDDAEFEGFYDLAGLEFPDGGSSAQYQITVERVDPLCSEQMSVGPYRSGQVLPSGTATPITVTVSKGADLTQDIMMASSALPSADSAGTFELPAKLPSGGRWVGSFSPYGNFDAYALTAHADRTLTLKITALDELGHATQDKAQPVIGIWRNSAAAGSPPDLAVPYFNSSDIGATILNAQFLTGGTFKLGMADYRGDGRPDFRYRGRIFYADTLSPQRTGGAGTTSLTIRGIGLDTGTTAKMGGNSVPVIASLPDRLVLSAPQFADGVYTIDLQAADGATSSLLKAITYGATATDRLQLLQGAGNPATPVGGEAPNPMRVRVVEADGVTPVAGAAVSLSTSPAGVLFSACGTASCTVFSDEQGEAASRMQVTSVGTFTITAAISSGANVKGTLVGTSSALDIATVSQSNWVAQGASLSLLLTVRVLSSGLPATGHSVQYGVTQGSASLSSPNAVSAADGYASVNLNIASLSNEIHISACVIPEEKPCANFYIFAVPASALRLEHVSGAEQIVNTRQTFSSVRLRVTDSSSPPNPVQGALVSVLTGVFRWQPDPPTNDQGVPIPPAPVVLSSSTVVVNSGGGGLVAITPVPSARFGAVIVKVIAMAGTTGVAQFELQRLWAPAGFTESLMPAGTRVTYGPRRHRVISSPRNRPTH